MSLASSTSLPSFVAALVEEDHHDSSAEEAEVDNCDGSPCMTRVEYREQVQILIVPEPRGQKDAVLTFWMHTCGLSEFGLPELELRNVPALYVKGAGDVLNTWGYYMVVEGQVIKAGERLGEGGPVPLTLLATGSPDPFWWRRSEACIRLEVEAVHGGCVVCGGTCPDDNHEDELGEDTDE